MIKVGDYVIIDIKEAASSKASGVALSARELLVRRRNPIGPLVAVPNPHGNSGIYPLIVRGDPDVSSSIWAFTTEGKLEIDDSFAPVRLAMLLLEKVLEL